MSKKNIVLVLILMVGVFLIGYSLKKTRTQVTENQKEIEITHLKMGLIPASDAEEMIREYKNITDYLSEKLGMTVEPEVTSDYTAAIEAMRSKHIDIAWFGPFSYILANQEAGAEALVNGLRRDTGKSTYKSIFITKADSGIKTIEDIKGKKMAFVDPASTSGYLIPMKILKENGIDTDNDFKDVYFAGTHTAVELAVANGMVDVGVDSDNSYERMVQAGDISSEVNVIFYESEPIPGSPIAVRGDLPKSLKEKIKQALLEMDQQIIQKVDGWGDIEKYVEVDDSDYDIIRETAKILNLKNTK